MTAHNLPLSGITVIELAGIGPAPFAGMHLQQMGAQVVRIEKPGGQDSILPADRDILNAGKKTLQLDLKSEGGSKQLLELASGADVLIDCYRPGVLERLGLGPEVLTARNPGLIIGRITGWGQDGPLAKTAGHDLNYISLTGALHAIGERDRPPQIPLVLLGDYAGGALYLVVGILAALHSRARTGAGRVVDAAIIDGVSHLLSGVHSAMALGMWKDERGANFVDGGSPFYSVYQTSDGQYMAVSCVETKFYAIFLELLGIDEVPAAQNDQTRWASVRQKIKDAFLKKRQAEWDAIFKGTEACVTPVLGLRAAVEHPHIAARGTLSWVDGSPRAAPAPRFPNQFNSIEDEQ